MSRLQPRLLLRRCLSSRSSQALLLSGRTGAGGTNRPGTTPAGSPSLLVHPAYHRQQDVAHARLATMVHNKGRFSTSSFPRDAGGDDVQQGGVKVEEERLGRASDKEPEGEFEDPRNAILDAALDHVQDHGFSVTALAAGATDCGFHSVASGMFPKGEVDLVYHLMAKSLQEVKRLGETGGSADKSSAELESEWPPSETERLRDGIKAALCCLAPYKAHWPHAMAIGLLPQNAGTTATAVAVLADELAFLSGDRSTDLAWYGKRGVIGGIYASTELFMLTDKSEGLSDTWAFLDRLLSDYELLASSPENAADVATGVRTVATSLSSAAVSLAGPFLKQASKKVPGAETVAQTAPNLSALASQALSFVASQVPHTGQPPSPPFSSASGPSASDASDHAGDDAAAPTFPGAPERDPWSEKPDAARREPGKFEEELEREERELFGATAREGDRKK